MEQEPVRGGTRAPIEGGLAAALARSEARSALCAERLALVQQVASLGFWDWHIESNELYWSDEIYVIFGLPRWEFGATYEAFLERVHPEDRQAVERTVEAALANREVYFLDHRIIRPDGVIRDVNEHARVQFGPNGKPVRMLGTVVDITARKEVERSLKRSEAKFRRLWESASNGMMMVSAAGEITMANRSAERLFLCEAGELVGRPVESLVPAPLRASHVTRRAEFQACPHARRMGERDSLKAIRGDGSEFDVEVSLTPLGTGPGFDVLVEIQDVSNRKLLESQFRQSQRLDALGKLAGGIAHDLNNVLTAIMGFSALSLRAAGDAHPCSGDIREILSASEHAKALIGQLLAFTRQQVLQPRVVNLNAAIAGTVRLLERLLRENIRLIADLGGDSGNVYVDPNQLEQILVNLAVNASDAMPGGGTLTISTQATEITAAELPAGSEIMPGEYVLFTVRDTGTGMTAEVLSHLFEPFYTTKGPGKGTGLGLSTVYGIVKQSKGHIEVESEWASGTAFTIYLPRTRRDPTQDSPLAQSPAFLRGEGTILLVEDNVTIRMLVVRILTENGYTVHEARDGKEALGLMAALPSVDLIISDVILPDTHGFALLRDILRNRPALPVLFVSGYTGESLETAGLEGHRFDVLPKPFTVTSLLDKVNAMVQQAPDPAGGTGSDS